MRAVLDPNVIISAALSPAGAPALVIVAWTRGAFELVACELLITELERALAYPKLSRRIPPDTATELVGLIRGQAELVADPAKPPPIRSADPGDDYLIALSAEQGLPLVSGDKHLLNLAPRLPILRPREFLDLLPGS